MFGTALIKPAEPKTESGRKRKLGEPPEYCLKFKASRSYCSRDVNEADEFMFTDVDYAMLHYRTNKTMQVCDDCAKACDRCGTSKATDLGPMATRGLDNTR